MKNQLIPDGERMLIEPVAAAAESKSGLILDNSTSNDASAKVLGVVIALGDTEFKGKPVPWKKGDKVMFRRYSLDTLKVMTDEGTKEYSLCDYQDILGHFEK